MTAAMPESIDVADRLERLEGEMTELRHTLSDLAQIVVGDIKERREAALTDTVPLPAVPIPASLIPGGQTTVTAVNALRRPWLLTELFRQIGTMVRMYFHPRYRVRRSTQLTVLLLFGLFVLNYLTFHVLILYVPIVSEVTERIFDIVLAVLLYMTLSREVVRYRQVVAHLGLAPRSWTPTPVSLLHNDPETAAVTREESP